MSKDSKRKICSECKKEKLVSRNFYKVNNSLFPDGSINICNLCVREIVNVDDIDSVIGFLRQIDKPFSKKVWEESQASGKYPLGEYIRKTNSLHQLRDKTFDDSDGVNGYGKIDVEHVMQIDEVETEQGNVIEYSPRLLKKWGTGYKKEEYLLLEKYYQDMMEAHEITTPAHIDMLRQLSYLSIDRDNLRKEGNWTGYKHVSETMDKMMDASGFKPKNIKSTDESSGMRSFSHIWKEVEKKGYRKPPPVKYDYDIVDQMLVSLVNYYHQLVGDHITQELPEEIREELDKFYEIDDIPDEIEDIPLESIGNDIVDEDDD